ncbi:choline kinase family protein [uncultured Roseibium sp.]|uniref:choline kinase family protein n=1 Tax=uncultured Roseibium sp. TaxID=1936171 RepID=UPI0032169992
MKAALRQYPELREAVGTVQSVTRLDGLTNRVYRVTTADGDFVLRLPRAENAGLIDREAEAHNLALAWERGFAPPAVILDPRSGILLTRAIEPRPASERVGPTALGRIVADLHSAPLAFRGVTDPDSLIDRQRADLDAHTDLVASFEPLADVLERLGPVSDVFAPVPSHGDLSPGNVLSGFDGPVLIDWEYSAMANPAWDLAYAILEHDFDASEERAFLAAYAETGNSGTGLCLEVLKMKIRCDAVSMLWALGQATKGNNSTDFEAFARTRLKRALDTYSNLSG